MYSIDYLNAACADAVPEPERETPRVVKWLECLPRGLFIDYGCGAGKLLAAAAGNNWKALGIEFDQAVAGETARRTGIEVWSISQAAQAELQADILHLGDVLEHLTDLGTQFPQILRYLKPGGLLMAQGPLEGNQTLLTLLMRLVRKFRGNPKSAMPPYHVILATARGQRAFFRRFSLLEIEFATRAVYWPAPIRIVAADLAKPRTMALYFLSRISRLIAAVLPSDENWSNRYFYAGRRSS
jgi:SAM-dependent methyltransferase